MLEYVNLTLDLYDGQGNIPTQGAAICTLSDELIDTVDHADIIMAPITVNFTKPTNGIAVEPIVKLLANDSPSVQQGSAWTITFQNVPGNPRTRTFVLSVRNGPDQYLSSQTDAQPVQQMAAFLEGSYPGDASKFLDGAGQWVAPTESGVLVPVTSVNGKIGDVVLAASDVGADAAGTAASAVDAEVVRAEAAEALMLRSANNLSDLANAPTARANLGLGDAATHPASDFALAADVVTSVNNEVGAVTIGAADVGAIPAGSVGTSQLVATTLPGSFTLINGTPTILTYQTPNDGNVHRLFATITGHTTVAVTGGQISINGTAPDGSAFSVTLQNGGHAVGVNSNQMSVIAAPNTTVTVVQSSAATAGSQIVWIDLWERMPAAQGNSSSTMMWGTDSSAFAAMQPLIPQTLACRLYVDQTVGVNGVPSSFPGVAVPAGVTRQVVSFRPNVPALLSGSLDSAISAYLAQAPAGTWLCAFHEANLTTNYFRTQGWTAAQFVQANQHIKNLAATANPNVKVGQVLYASSAAVADSPWVTPGLDWYGLDGYGGAKDKSAAEVFDTAIQNILNVVPNATLAIIENNSSQAPTSAAWNQWFIDAFGIAQSYNMAMFMPWFGASPTDTPPAFDTNGTYVPTLKSLAASL